MDDESDTSDETLIAEYLAQISWEVEVQVDHGDFKINRYFLTGRSSIDEMWFTESVWFEHLERYTASELLDSAAQHCRRVIARFLKLDVPARDDCFTRKIQSYDLGAFELSMWEEVKLG